MRDDGAAELARGRSLFGLGRFVEAREAFASASAHGPHILEAMLLRREVDRALKGVRAAAGTAHVWRLELPPHLGGLRDVLASGQHHDAIAILRGAAHDHDALAQLLLASLLCFERRYPEAAIVYDHVVTLGEECRHVALLGKADVLLVLDRPEEALALFHRVRIERPDLSDALEGHARALHQLGRTSEADDVFTQYIALTGRRSELRVRSR